MPSEELPTLEHDIPPPETYLPGTPDWFWWLLGTGLVLILLLFFWTCKILKPAPKPPAAPKRDLFSPAIAELKSLEESCDKYLLSKIAAQASLAIRTYLADAQSEPALFETAEEFQARQTILPPEINRFLNELNDAKYTKSKIDEEKARDFVARSRECIETLHQTPSRKTPPLPLPPRRHFTHDLLALVPLGLATALGAFLFDLYDGSDTGSQIKMNMVSWIALGVSAASLLAHLIARSKS